MRTILVPLDGSRLAEQVIPQARALAALLDARLRLLTVIPDSAVDEGDTFGYDLAAIYGVGDALRARREHEVELREALHIRARRYLEQQAEALAALGTEATYEVRFGPPAEVIVETAEAEHVALVAMATHGYSGLKRWALGSVADKVIHASCAPVLVVRGVTSVAAAPAVRRIVVPLDGSPLAKQALPLGAELARRAGAELVLLRATMPTIDLMAGMPPAGRLAAPYEDLTEPMRQSARRELEGIAGQLRGEDVRVEVAAPIGDPAELIVDEAAAHQADLIVMATHGYSGLRRWALGSVADKVLHATTTPLILVRAKG
jgi:nucleotide-binding universal stress UspA family protein